MKLSIILFTTVVGDLISYNRGVNNAFQHIRSKRIGNAASTDNRIQLAKYMIHLGRFHEARELMAVVGETRNDKQNARYGRYVQKL